MTNNKFKHLPHVLTEFKSRALLFLLAMSGAILQADIRSHAEISQLVEIGFVVINQKVC